MYNPKLRTFLVLGLMLAWVAVATSYYLLHARKKVCPVGTGIESAKEVSSLKQGKELLRVRKDKQAQAIFEGILKTDPGNIEALCAKAELLRRSYKYKEAEDIYNGILKKNPEDMRSLNGLAYIRYTQGRLDESQKLVNKILKTCTNKQNEALAYLTLGAIYSKRASEGWLLSKIKYGTQIKKCFLKAKELAPDMPETHMGLGTFYLKAPSIVGGNLDLALKELEIAVKMAPEFATANARLAQAYKKSGDLTKYSHYLEITKKLDPQNEVLKELE